MFKIIIFKIRFENFPAEETLFKFKENIDMGNLVITFKIKN